MQMRKMQLTLQKPVMMIALAMGVLMFVYALGFATDMYSLSYHTDQTSMFYVQGAELYKIIQPYNKMLLNESTVLFLLAVSNFLFMAHKRRLYYLSNYITGAAFSAYAVYMGFRWIQYVHIFKARYLQVDFEQLKVMTEMMNLRYVKSTFMMDCGTVLSILLFVVAAIVIANLVVKTMWMREEKRAMAAAGLA